MSYRNTACLAGIAIALAAPAFAQTLPMDVRGRWDVSREACDAPGASVTGIEITGDRITSFGGNAIVRDVERTGQVTYVAADFLQLEGAVETEARKRTYYRLTQRDGPDRLNVIWKDVETVDLIHCVGGRSPGAALSLPTGF